MQSTITSAPPLDLTPSQHVAMRRNIERIAAQSISDDPTSIHYHRVLMSMIAGHPTTGNMRAT